MVKSYRGSCVTCTRLFGVVFTLFNIRMECPLGTSRRGFSGILLPIGMKGVCVGIHGLTLRQPNGDVFHNFRQLFAPFVVTFGIFVYVFAMISMRYRTIYPRWLLYTFGLLCCFSAQGQTGPFGIGNATGADGQPRLVVWLDGSTPAVAPGTDVLLWPDKSGNGNDFTAVAATSPVLTSGNATINNRPFLNFGKTDNRMVLNNLTLTDGAVSIFYVFRTGDATFGMFSMATSDANPRQVLVHQQGGQTRFTVGGNEFITSIGALSNGAWRYAGFVWEAGTNPTYWHRSSGTGAPELEQTNVLTTENAAATGTAVIGHIQNLLNGGYNSDESFQGELAELIVYDGRVNRAMLRQINTYFRNKYNVGGMGSWDKLGAPAGFREGLIGIARDNGSNSEHRHSRADGLVLRANAGGLQGTFAYLSAGHSGMANSVVTTELAASVDARWARSWYVKKDGLTNPSDVQMAFDFGEGIPGGQFPGNPDGYVLLYRLNNSGNFAVQAVTEKYILDKEVVFRVTGAQIQGAGYYTLGTTNNISSNLTGQNIRTWYAYQSGNWSNPLTWTLDGSAAPTYINPSGSIPAVNDAVVIASGRAVQCDLNDLTQSSLSLFGTLDIATSSGHDMTTISGNGTLRCAGAGGVSNFPGGNTAAFANAATGGLTEFYGSGFTLSQNLVLNRLRINMTAETSTVTLAANLTHNGFFEIVRGTLEVNNTAGNVRSIESFGDVLVETQGRVRASATNVSHQWTFHKDFVNEGGDVRMTNRVAPNYDIQETQGHIRVRFVSATANQNLVANGTTYLSRLVVNKGSNATYVLTVTSDGPGKFALYGPANSGMAESEIILEASQTNSVAIVNGTLEIRENIFLPLQTGAGNYNINATAALWVNGGFAAKGAPDVGTGNAIAIVPYGLIRVSAGTLNANCQSGITTRGNGVLQVDGGEVNANQIRTSIFGSSNQGGVVINGGVVNVDGTRPGGSLGTYYTFSLTYTGNLFRMTGGQLIVSGPSASGLIFINSDPQNTSVSGGTVVAISKTTTGGVHRITSRAAFWNFEVRRIVTGTNLPITVSGGDSFGQLIGNLPLRVRNELKITGANAAALRMRSVDNVDLDAFVEGNMVIENGGIYDHQGTSTTHFIGGSNSILTLPTSTTPTFRTIVVEKNSDTRFVEIQGGNTTLAMIIEGQLRVERGAFNHSNFNVQTLGKVVNRGTIGTELGTGVFFLQGTTNQEIVSDNGIFHNLTLNNAAGATLANGSLRVRRTMALQNGNFNLQSFKLRIESPTGEVSVASPSATRCFVTGGSPSDGGLEVIFKSAAQETTFPMGVNDGGIKYVPAEVRINNDFADEGYIRIVPVKGPLPTTNYTAFSDHLAFYWKVVHSEFGVVPRVSHRFQYDDTQIVGNANNFSSGRVLFDAPFDRQTDQLPAAPVHVDVPNRFIYYNGTDVAQSMIGSGTLLTNASYTAGHEDMFVGRPKVFYSRNATLNADFNVAANWNELDQFSAGDDVFDYHSSSITGNLEFPQAGDIAFIGFDPATGRPHSYQAPVAGVTASEVRFTPLQTEGGVRLPRWNGPTAADITVLRPTFSFSDETQITNIVSISGEGTLLMRDNVNLNVVDIGNFLEEDSSIVMVESAVAAVGGLEITTLPAQVPNLFITSTANGSNPNGVLLRSNTQVKGNLEVAGRAKLILNDGTSGNITVGGFARLDQFQATSSSPEVLFSNGGPPRTLTVKGNLILKGAGAQIRVDGANAPQIVHRLVVHGNIVQNAPSSTALNLFTDASSDYISLTLTGTGNHSFQNTVGNAPQLGSLIVDKGSNRTSGFSFNSLINIGAAADGAEKPVQLRNGLLTLNNSSIDITLSSGGANFNIPVTSGLALQQGTLRINGSEVGLNLAGLLRISGGLFELGNTAGVNNYLEYSVGGTAILEVFGGQLNVGSQLRRGLTSTEGVLNYRQTAGEVRVGVHAAPTASRGVFEVLNTGSNFEFTGGELVIVRGINSATVPSLRLQPTTSSVGPSGFLTIGNAASPIGASVKNIGIQSSVALPSLTVNNASGNGPVAKLYGLPLTIQQELIITAGSTFDSQFLTLTVQGDIDNEGLLKSDNGTLVLNHTGFNDVSGNGVFDLNNLNRTGGGVTNVASNLLVKGNFSFDTETGIIQAGIHTLTLRGNATVDGEIKFTSGEGMILSGSADQQLRRTGPGTSRIDILTADNPSGIQQPAGQGYVFQIGNALRLRRGIFNLNGNLLELGASANIVAVNAFGQNNMITTGGSFTNFGLRKTFAVNTQQDFFAPLGLDKYMPIRLVLSDVGFGTGSTESSYLFKLVQPGSNVLLDPTNALQMYFSMIAEGVGSGLRMDAEMTYDDSYVAVTAPNTVNDYIGARVVNGSPPSVFKFFDAVNPSQRLLVFSFNNVTAEGISGDYFAGIDAAIPDFIPEYVTTRSGNVTEGDEPPIGTYDIEVPGGSAPNGAVVRIQENHTLNLNINGVTLYKTIIEEGAVLNIDNTSFHRLGIVEGTGTIRLNNTGSLPSGLYNQFFTCSGGRLEFAGTAGYEILAGIPIVRSVRLSGSGNRILANNDLFVCEDVVVNGPHFQNANLVNVIVDGNLVINTGEFNNVQGTLNLEGNLSVSNGTFTSGNIGTRTIEGDILQSGGTIQTGTGGVLRLKGNYLKSGGTFSGTATAKVELAGTSQQVLSGNFSGTNALRVLEINNAAGVKMHNNIDLAIRLDLTLGHIYTAQDSVLRLGTAATVVPARGKPTSFIHGPVDWVNLATTGGERIFPVGKGQWHRPLTLANRSAQRTWTVEYYDTTATTHSGIANLLPEDPFVIKTVSNQEFWRVNSNTTGATNALVGLSWGDGSVVAPLPGDFDKLVVLKWDGPGVVWQSAGANSSSFNFEALTQTGNFLSASATSFTERFFTLGSSDAINPLPVTFLHFTGTTDGRHHRLAWATASEVNNDYFELERSADGIHFVAIARVEGAGNSNTRINYHFTDQAPPQGRAYYRLRQVDFDGAFAYANEIVTLVRTDVSPQKLDFLIYPNPTTDGSARLMMPDLAAQLVLVAITDLSGRTVWRQTVWVDEQGISEPLDCNFRAGVYIVSVLHDNAMRSKPLVISQ